MRPIAISMTAKGLLSLVGFTIGFLVNGLECGALGLVMAWLATLFAYDLPQALAIPEARLDPPRFDPTKLARLFGRALPLGITISLVALSASIPRGFVKQERDFAEVGVFAAARPAVNPGIIVINALGQSATPRLARLHADGARREFLALFGKMMLLALGLGGAGILVAFLIGGPVLRLLFRPEYAEHVDLLVWLMIAAGLDYAASIIGYAMTAARVFRSQVPLFAVVCAVTFIGCRLWTGRFGLVGAAFGIILAKSVQLAGSAILLAIRMRRGATT